MTRDALAAAIQEWQDAKWAVPLCTEPPSRSSYELADHLIRAGFIHRSHAATLGVDDLLAAHVQMPGVGLVREEPNG